MKFNHTKPDGQKLKSPMPFASEKEAMNMPGRWVWRGALALLIGMAAGIPAVLWLTADPPWESAIAAFEAQDRRQPPAPGQVVFVGSSTFRFWRTLAADMAPVPVLNRGFGGAWLRDVLRYADRIITPYQPRAVVVYAGENDLGFRWSSPDTVVEQFRQLTENLRTAHAHLPILLLAIKPSPHFAARLAQQQEANRRLRAYCEDTPGLYFIDIARPLLSATGRPRPELYRDGLHLNAAGYAVLRDQVYSVLLKVLGLSSESVGTDTAVRAPPEPLPSPGSVPALPAYSLPPSP